ncbi:YugN family protein [Marinicrinis lubricantis]|uniref:YugN family protein n=1 Tax=Marinicrinis lubricantis TaxID=2086470 RepID=A0ABW1ILN8_9BACL
MFPIASRFENREDTYTDLNQALKPYGFTLGGNWEYDHGSFDCALDEGHKVWLRIPFEVTKGNLDNLKEEQQTVIRFGTPYLLKHVYNEGLEEGATLNTFGGLMNQFQTPLDQDADMEPEWIEKAEGILRKMESDLL